jgi:hypothetical protein
MTPTMEQAKARWHSHTRRTLNEEMAGKKGMSWSTEANGTPCVTIGGQHKIYFHINHYGHVYATLDSAPRGDTHIRYGDTHTHYSD